MPPARGARQRAGGPLPERLPLSPSSPSRPRAHRPPPTPAQDAYSSPSDELPPTKTHQDPANAQRPIAKREAPIANRQSPSLPSNLPAPLPFFFFSLLSTLYSLLSRLLAPQFIYVMKGLRKVVPPSREILRDIWLSFYPGAKIGVLGANGAGKSSLLRIMAGVDQDFQGEAWPHAGTRVGFLPQEPQLDAGKDVRGNVELAVQATRDLLTRFEQISLQFARADDRRRDDQAARRAGQGAGADRCRQRLGARSADRNRHGCAPPAAGGRVDRDALGRRAPPGGALPRPVRAAGHATARRAHQSPRRGERGLAGTTSRRSIPAPSSP